MTLKVVFVGGEPCAFCKAVIRLFPSLWRPSSLTIGRVYTVQKARKVFFPLDLSGTLFTTAYTLAEIQLEGTWQHCSCEFREIDGDPEAWQRVLEKNRPKTKELELT